MHTEYECSSKQSLFSQKVQLNKTPMMYDERDDCPNENNYGSSKSLFGERVELRNFSDESDLFSDVWNRNRGATSQDSLEQCLGQVYKPSRENLELLQKHNVVTKGGMLLVDPMANKKVELSGCNHSLTNHDLFIVQDERYRELDEFSLVSNVTEVTYGIEKRDTTLGREPSLGIVPKPSMNEVIRPGCGGIDLEAVFDSVRLRSSCGNVDRRNAGDDVVPNFDEVHVCITSIYIATLDELKEENERPITEQSNNIGLRCAWNEPTLSHKLGATFIEGPDGRAYVNQVIFGSHAASCGIKKGDVVSFAVPLNHAIRGYDNAVDLVRKLDFIGMRTSYRELFDMFLSKTTSGLPIAFVFRREADSKTSFPVTLQSIIQQAAGFLHELVCKSRESDYQQESLWTHEIIRGNIELFFPRPIIREKSTSIGLWNTLTSTFEGISTRNYHPLLPSCVGSLTSSQFASPVLWRCQFLKTIFEDVSILLYASFTRSSTTDTSIIMSRAYDGSWSDPISVKCAVSDSSMVPLIGAIEYVMLIHDPTILIPLCRSEKVDLYSNGQNSADAPNPQITESYNNTTLIKYKGTYYVGHDVRFMIMTSQGFSSTPTSRTECISSLHGALKRIESPSTMYPHPPVPRNLVKFAHCDWGDTTLRRYVDGLKKNDVQMDEETREIDIFHQKFKLLLIDGLSVDHLQFSEAMSSIVSGKLVLSILPGEKMDCGCLQFLVKMMNMSNGSTTTVIEMDLSLITRINQNAGELALQKKAKKRFISIETHDKKKFMFLARTSKDAELLLCGFKLVIEKILLATMETRAHLSSI